MYSLIFFNIIRPASIDDNSGFNGERPRAISSALMKILQLSISGKTVKDAVVLPAPLQPAIIYKFGII
jgi:hypothetical protein